MGTGHATTRSIIVFLVLFEVEALWGSLEFPRSHRPRHKTVVEQQAGPRRSGSFCYICNKLTTLHFWCLLFGVQKRFQLFFFFLNKTGSQWQGPSKERGKLTTPTAGGTDGSKFGKQYGGFSTD